MPLPSIPCPLCGTILEEGPGEALPPATWRDCLRRCPLCEVGFSNSPNAPTLIFNDPRMNVPPEVRGGVLEALALALNERNRPNKRTKFGFSTSEDALTWTVFKYLHDSGQLLDVLGRAGLPIPDRVSRPEALLLWGVPVPLDRTANERGWRIREQLETIADGLGEDPRSRTEPDVLIDLGASGVLIMEAKHRSPTNVRAAEYAGWDRYYPIGGGLPYAARMRASGCYELARNWRFGLELVAGIDRPFALVCLGPEGLFLGEAGDILGRFEACLPTGGRTMFAPIRWESLLGSIINPPDWLMDYARDRGYATEDIANDHR